ncbi:uncharacterized protein A4U43_C01F28540 [Asparagus officinalis]|uniref:Uncharacterized protein n=1 Tax=Asparagus officinalis TaxID=4686 RepID=A0A5P1FT40_ASPOF|nr:uncharacterized protein A4U43_C01F28540 [Asparagus officinalis]
MAAISNTQIYKSLQSYWRRKSYQKLESSSMKNNRRVVKLGQSSRRRRNKRSWSVRVSMRIRTVLRIPSPKKLMLRLRDAYVSAMLVVAGWSAGQPQKSVVELRQWLVRRVPRAREVKGGGDFEMMMMMHIYRNLMASPRQLTSCV